MDSTEPKRDRFAIEVRTFQRCDFETLTRWFEDEKLNAELGPLDQEWLDFVLAEDPPSQFSCLRDNKMVAVVGIKRREENELENFHVVTDIAVNPTLRRCGVGSAALEKVIESVGSTHDWRVYVDRSNVEAQRFFESQNWIAKRKPRPSPKTSDNKKDEMICFRRNRQNLDNI